MLSKISKISKLKLVSVLSIGSIGYIISNEDKKIKANNFINAGIS
jgi:preprotein translocase subunit Sss1